MNRRTRRSTVAALAVTPVLLLAGCGSGSGGSAGSSSTSDTATPSASPSAGAPASPSASPSAGASAGTTAAVITIKDYKYTVPASVAPGTKVMITNQDSVAHTVTADQGSAFDVNVQAGKTVALTAPAKAGRYDFHCTFHSNMEGTLVVG